MRVAILCLDHVFDSALHIVRDVLSAAARLDDDLTPDQIETITLTGDSVQTASEQQLQPDRSIADVEPDIVVLPGVLADRGAETIEPMLQTRAAEAASDWMRSQHARGAEIATACTGVWFVAEAGLLDGREATTTWHLASDFRKRFPRVKLKVGRMLTYDDSIRCAGAAMAHMDLALALVTALCGGRTSRGVASLLLLDDRPSQAHYMATQYLQIDNEDFRRIDAWARENLSRGFSMQELAKACGMSQRTLARRVESAAGETPLRFVQRIRAERALQLLETTPQSFSEITAQVGYSEPATLRRLIRDLTGRSPSEIRSNSQRTVGSR